jgi:hypothetical protein
MTEEEKQKFLSDCRYFYREKGEMERLIGFSMEKLEEADPVLASAYKQLKLAEETFGRLINYGE